MDVFWGHSVLSLHCWGKPGNAKVAPCQILYWWFARVQLVAAWFLQYWADLLGSRNHVEVQMPHGKGHDDVAFFRITLHARTQRTHARTHTHTHTHTDFDGLCITHLSAQGCVFVGSIYISPHLGVISPKNPNFGDVNRHFQAKRAKY